MKRSQLFIAIVVILTIISSLFVNGCTTQKNTKLTIVTGTSLVAYIVQQVGGELVTVVNLVPPTQHPGNFDVKPSDIQTLANADVFLLQGLPAEVYADQLVTSANNSRLKVVKASVNGNWMIPSIQQAATDRISAILGEIDPPNASKYSAAAAQYKQRIIAEEVKLKAKLDEAKVSQVNAIASIRQADFLQWAGINVTGTFGAVNTLTPQVIKQLVDSGKQANVTLIVNNLQDGPDAGKGIAEEIGAKNVNLSNFPGGFANTETWEKAVGQNVDLILKAIAN